MVLTSDGGRTLVHRSGFESDEKTVAMQRVCVVSASLVCRPKATRGSQRAGWLFILRW